jgi:hypothetical protein
VTDSETLSGRSTDHCSNFHSMRDILINVVLPLSLICLLLWAVQGVATSKHPGLLSGQPLVATFVGNGVWWGRPWYSGATWPFVRLDVYPTGIRIGPNFRVIGWLHPTTEFAWSEILWSRVKGGRIEFKGRPDKGWVEFNQQLRFTPGAYNELVSTMREHGISFLD